METKKFKKKKANVLLLLFLPTDPYPLLCYLDIPGIFSIIQGKGERGAFGFGVDLKTRFLPNKDWLPPFLVPCLTAESRLPALQFVDCVGCTLQHGVGSVLMPKARRPECRSPGSKIINQMYGYPKLVRDDGCFWNPTN